METHVSDEKLRVLAEEQAALRRVATLVAGGAAPEKVFAAATEEVAGLLPVEFAILGRYESDGTVLAIAAWGAPLARFPVGSRWSLDGKNLVTIVLETGRPARVDRFEHASGPLGVVGRESGFHSTVGTPIVVDGRLWGVMCVGSTLGSPMLPEDTEPRLVSFTELLAMAIANAESRAELTASRARIVAAADETRRRIQRDLHDETQQQLVSLMLELRAAQTTSQPEVGELMAQLAAAERALGRVLGGLREIASEIHPAMLSKGGLERALRALARRSPVPVELDLRVARRMPEHVEVAVYYVVSEALKNSVKYAHSSVVNVGMHVNETIIELAIRDDGIGGAHLGHGSGLLSLSDRIHALGGTLQLTSPVGSGTTLLIEIPVTDQRSTLAPEP
jgi:signal transduction histidine kinase